MSAGAHAVTTNDFPQWDRELLFRILDNIHDVVLVIDSDTTIVYANEAYVRILGIPVAKVLGRRLDKIEPKAAAIEILRTGKAVNGEDYLDSLKINVVEGYCQGYCWYETENAEKMSGIKQEERRRGLNQRQASPVVGFH